MAKDSISKLYTFLLFAFPLVSNYDFIGVSPALVFCFIEFMLALLCKHGSEPVRIDRRIIVYVIYMLISAVIGILNSEQNSMYTIFMKCTLYLLFFFVFYVFSWQVIDLKYAIDLYIRIASIVSILVIIQFGFAAVGKGFALIIPGIPMVGEDGKLSDLIQMAQIANKRFSSVFFEPAHQCEYVIPCLALVLFKGDRSKTNSRDIAAAVLLTIGCFCTTSTIGILSSAAIWGFWALTLIKQKGASGIFYLIVLAPVVTGIAVFFLGFENVSNNLLTRLAVLNFRDTSVTTEGFRRVRYGWICFWDMDLIHKIFGAGYKNFGYYIAKIGTGYRYYKTNDVRIISYMNGITGMLIGLGVVGTVLNLRLYLWDLLKTKNVLVYGLLLSWALIMFSADSFDYAETMLPLVLAMAIVFPDDKNKRFISLTI